MATQAKVIIKGQNDIGKAVKSASDDLQKLTEMARKVGTAMKTAFSVTAIAASIQKIGSVTKTLITEDFGGANRAYKQLAIALKDKSAYDSVTENLDRLCQKTLTANGDIEEMVAELAALGKTAPEINKISTAAVALSNVTGKDMKSSMTTLLNTYNGTTTQLRKLGIDLSNVTQEELAQGAAIDVVIESLEKYSDQMANEDTNQALKNMSETWGDIKEKIGGVIDYNFGPLIRKLDTTFADLGEQINAITIYVGGIIANFPEAFHLLMDTLGEMVRITFSWDGLKEIFTTLFKNIGIAAMAMIKALFTSIPTFIGNLFMGVVDWIAYIGLNLQATVMDAIQNAINSVGGWIHGTWVGKIFGLGESLENFNFGGDKVRAKAETKKSKAEEHMGKTLPALVDTINTAVDTAVEINSNNKKAVKNLYGDTFEGFKNALDEIVGPELEIIAKHSNASDQDNVLTAKSESSGTSSATETSATNGNASGQKEQNKQFNNFSKQLADILNTTIGTSMTDVMEHSSGFAAMFLENEIGIFGEMLSAIGPVIDIVMNSISPMQMLLTIIQGFVSIMEPALTTVFQPLNDVLSWIGQILASLFLPILDQLHVFLELIANIIQAVIAPVLQLITPFMQIVSALLEALSPMLVGLAKGITILMSPVQFLADLFTWLGEWISYCGHCIEVFAHNLVHPFRKWSYGSSPGGFSSDAFTGLEERLNGIDALAQNDTTVTDSVATGTAISSAGYQGATQVTINIYQQAPVVGDGGMKTFARMIRREFEELDYFGVTT